MNHNKIKKMIKNKKNYNSAISSLHQFLGSRKTEVFRGKKGILRIIEASVAIFILLGFVALILVNQIQKPNLRDSAYQIGHQILREIADNYTLRNDILQENTTQAAKYAESRLSEFAFLFSLSACNISQSCMCSTCPGNIEIYADDMIISTNLSDYAPKKLALFLWIPPGIGGTVPPVQPPGGCNPSCAGKECGSDGCGANSNCGTCIPGCDALNHPGNRYSGVCTSAGVCESTNVEICGDGTDNNCDGTVGDGCAAQVCTSPAGNVNFVGNPINSGGFIMYMTSSSLTTGNFRLRVYYNNDVYQTGATRNIAAPTDLNKFITELPWTAGSVITVEYSTDNFVTSTCQARKQI
jgi:hypothetical protein